ncbi:MAG: MlaD family protein [Phycisphaerales bacterium]|nr:MlaD family protein [Phycisphaerales bacterium]
MADQDDRVSSKETCQVSKGVPVATVRPRRWSFAWIVPVLALVVVGFLVWTQVSEDQGTMITIKFLDAGGIEPGTEIKHRGVTVGVVRKVSLADDLTNVDVFAELKPETSELASEGTKFWLVKARLSLGKVAGLDTLVGPRYIALQPGGDDQSAQFEFIAMTDAPAGEPAGDGSMRFILMSDRLGTLSPGNPVLYREIRVGTVRGAQLTNDSTGVMISIDIDARFTPLIHEKTRFWRSGGVGVDFGIFSGLSVQADSLEAAMSSSVSLATPSKKPGERASVGDTFELADSVDEDWLKWSPKIEIGP